MAIESLRSTEEISTVSNGSEAEVSTEALVMLGLVKDREKTLEEVNSDFDRLDQAGTEGIKYVQLPRRLAANLGYFIRTFNHELGIPNIYFAAKLWVPGAHRDSYKANEIGNLELGQSDDSWPAHGRLAVHNPCSAEEPLLHFLGMPFDEECAVEGEQTQLEALAQAKKVYEAAHPEFSYLPLNCNAFAMLALMARIKGEPMPVSSGFMMNDATLPRKAIDGTSAVGSFSSSGPQLEFFATEGEAWITAGVGVTVGPKNIES